MLTDTQDPVFAFRQAHCATSLDCLEVKLKDNHNFS